jgi:cytochrome c oxidase assembly protein subunit 20
MWEAFGNPKEPINTMPGGTYNSAGGKPAEPTFWNALTTLDLFNREGKPAFYQTSCARDSLMVGIGAGGAIGGIRFIVKGKSCQMAPGHCD